MNELEVYTEKQRRRCQYAAVALLFWMAAITYSGSESFVFTRSPPTGMDNTGRHTVHKFPHFSGEGVVTGANQETIDFSFVVSCWEAKNLTQEQNASYKFHEFDVRTYGAMGDGETLNTRAFQKALDAAATIDADTPQHNQTTNIGIVLVRNGVYKVGGSINLHSYTLLYVHSSAMVLGSAKEEDFPYPDAWESEGNPLFPQGILPILIRAKHQHHVGLFGGGVLDGGAFPGYIQGFNASLDKFEPLKFRQSGAGVDQLCQGECRPQLGLFEHCDTVIVQDITMQNSPDWTLHIRGSSNVFLTRLHIYGDWRWPNNDGIDVDSSSHVTVSYSKIETADDAVCIKTTKGYGETKNILIHSNLLKSRSSAFKIGSSTQENVSHVMVDSVTIQAGTNRALAIQHRDRGNIFKVHIRNIIIEKTELQPQHWWGTGEPIYVTSTPRFAKDWPLGKVTQITFEHIRAYSVAGTAFVGYRNEKDFSLNSTISRVVFLDVKICMGSRSGSGSDPTGRILYERPSRDFRPTYNANLKPELDPYPSDEEIGFFFDHVKVRAQVFEDKLEPAIDAPGVMFYKSAIFFPPSPGGKGEWTVQDLVWPKPRLSSGPKRIAQNCIETAGISRGSKSTTGLRCHLGRVCFPQEVEKSRHSDQIRSY